MKMSSSVNQDIERKVLDKFKTNIKNLIVVVISDYQKGLLTKTLITKLIKNM